MTNSVSIRDVKQDDLPILFEHQLNPDAVKMAAFPPRDWDAFTAHWEKIMANENVITKTILCDGQVAGSLVCFEMDGKFEVGYWIGREFWGMGIASESLKQLFGQVSKRPLYAHVAKHNAASQRVLQKCGFEVIGEGKWTPSPEIGETEEFIYMLK
jgi:RimJ/RimL family protein N-acetyltransferase